MDLFWESAAIARGTGPLTLSQLSKQGVKEKRPRFSKAPLIVPQNSADSLMRDDPEHLSIP